MTNGEKDGFERMARGDIRYSKTEEQKQNIEREKTI